MKWTLRKRGASCVYTDVKIYLYLASRGYELSVGRIGKLECDFIARRRNAYAYIQVSMSIADRGVEEREYRPFGHIRDGYPATCSRLILYCRRGMASGILTWRRLCKMAVILFEWWPDPFAPKCANSAGIK